MTGKDIFKQALKNPDLARRAREIVNDDRRKGGSYSRFNRELHESAAQWADRATEVVAGRDSGVFVSAVAVLECAIAVLKWNGKD